MLAGMNPATSIFPAAAFGNGLERSQHSLILHPEGTRHERHDQPHQATRRKLETPKYVHTVDDRRKGVNEPNVHFPEHGRLESHRLLKVEPSR